MKKSTKTYSKKDSLNVALAFDDSLDRPDGVQQQLKLLGEWLGQNGHSVSYLAGQTEFKKFGRHKIYSLSRNFKVSANQNSLSLPLPAGKRRVEKVFERQKFDVVHITLPFSPFLGRQIVKTAFDRGIPVIGTFHTFPASRLQIIGSWLYGRWLRRYLKRFSSVISVSEATRHYAAKSFSTGSEVVPNYIDTKRFVSGKPIKGLKKDGRVVLYLSRLVKRKGPQHLLEAVNLLHREGKFKNNRLVMCGSGALSKTLRTRAMQLKLTSKVDMPGFIDEEAKADYLASADLAVYPATGGEAFGIVLLESMASGALTLGGDNPGYRSVLKDQPKLLVDAADHEALAQRIHELLTDDKQRRKLLRWQRETVKQYDISNVGPKILQLYWASLG